MTAPDLSLLAQIRTMQKEDLEQVQAIDRNSFSLPWPTSAYNYELSNPMSLLWVAEIPVEASAPKIVGMIVVWIIVDEAHIATLAVEADYRGKGIGKLLLATAMKEAIRSGMREATLEVRSGNLAAQSLYQRFKFQIIGFRPRYYRDNSEDALIMTMNNLGTAYQDWLESGSWRTQVETTIPKSTVSGAEIYPIKE